MATGLEQGCRTHTSEPVARALYQGKTGMGLVLNQEGVVAFEMKARHVIQE